MSRNDSLPPRPGIKRRYRRPLHGFDAARALAASDKGTIDLRRKDGPETWYILRIEPQREFAAETILTKRGATAFVPVETKFPRLRRGSRIRDKKAEPKRYPIFPGYVFARFHGTIPMHQLARLYVIKGVVGLEGRPYEVPAAIIEKMKALSANPIAPRRSGPNPHKSFQVGETVEIVGGPFEGHTLPIVGIDAKMAEFFVQFLGTKQKVKVPLSFLEAA